MIFVGDDWAEDHHDVHLMDEAGGSSAKRRLPEGWRGSAGFMSSWPLTRKTRRGGDRHRDRSRPVGPSAVAAGYQLYAINPLAVSATATVTMFLARSPTPVTRSYSPIWCAPTGTIIGDRRGQPRPTRSRSSPGGTEPDLDPEPPNQRAAPCVTGVLPGRAGPFDDLAD